VLGCGFVRPARPVAWDAGEALYPHDGHRGAARLRGISKTQRLGPQVGQGHADVNRGTDDLGCRGPLISQIGPHLTDDDLMANIALIGRFGLKRHMVDRSPVGRNHLAQNRNRPHRGHGLLAETDIENAGTVGLNGDVQGNDIGDRFSGRQGDDGGEGVQHGLNIGGLKGGVGGDGLGLERYGHGGFSRLVSGSLVFCRNGASFPLPTGRRDDVCPIGGRKGLPFRGIVSALRGPKTGFSVHIAIAKKAFSLVVKIARNANRHPGVLFGGGDGFLTVQDGPGFGDEGFAESGDLVCKWWRG